MNIFIRYIQNYLIFSIPFVIACMTWETINPKIAYGISTPILTKILWNILCINLGIWFIALFLFLIILITIPSIREKTLSRLANLKERDEREQYITGKAARASYISTLSLSLFLLFLSMFSVTLTRASENQAPPGHRLALSIGLSFSLLNKSKSENIPGEAVMFDSKNISLSSSSFILLLLCWQLLSFNIAARREQINNS